MLSTCLTGSRALSKIVHLVAFGTRSLGMALERRPACLPCGLAHICPQGDSAASSAVAGSMKTNPHLRQQCVHHRNMCSQPAAAGNLQHPVTDCTC